MLASSPISFPAQFTIVNHRPKAVIQCQPSVVTPRLLSPNNAMDLCSCRSKYSFFIISFIAVSSIVQSGPIRFPWHYCSFFFLLGLLICFIPFLRPDVLAFGYLIYASILSGGGIKSIPEYLGTRRPVQCSGRKITLKTYASRIVGNFSHSRGSSG